MLLYRGSHISECRVDPVVGKARIDLVSKHVHVSSFQFPASDISIKHTTSGPGRVWPS